jgi:hypothetical protein
VITGDLDAALGPAAVTAGTWRQPPGLAARPGSYATPAAFRLARSPGPQPAGPEEGTGPLAPGSRASGPQATAARLAARLAGLDWVAAATVTGGGFLTVQVTQPALAMLAVRIPKAGPGCARSAVLAGLRLPGPPPEPAGVLICARSWEEAHQRLARALTARLAAAAGATIHPQRGTWPPPDPRPAGGPVADAVGFAGADAIAYALARIPPGRPARVDPGRAAAPTPHNPAYAVRYAHAHAASTLRQAADLGSGPGQAAGFCPGRLAHPCELSLLHELSWLPERVVSAARRGRPDVLARYLERLAGAYLRSAGQCPALPPGGPACPERLWLAAAAATALAAGLRLLGVHPPDRLLPADGEAPAGSYERILDEPCRPPSRAPPRRGAAARAPAAAPGRPQRTSPRGLAPDCAPGRRRAHPRRPGRA